jgi:serine phosphatase RsbU (regulator of sigma subunit)
MQNIWNYISNLGTTGEDRQLSQKFVVLSNQLNSVMFISMFLLLITTLITQWLTHNILSYGTLRVALTLILSFLNLVFARYGYTKLSRLSIIFLPSIIFLLAPILIGYVQEEEFTYYPYVVIGISIIPQLLVHPHKEKFLYWFSLSYYFLLVIFIDRIMVQFGKPELVEPGMYSYPIVERIKTFYPFYKIAQIGLFLFINADIYYLRILNFRFEYSLNKKNHILDLKNKELTTQRGKILLQKNIIEQKSQDITSSIKYASRIQAAVLPPINFLTEWGIDNFILYKPKEIVSGDFYWGFRKQRKIVIAAADCTGHGVPGAFMSMLGHALLNEILNNIEVENAATILNLLRDDVINTLRQKGTVGETRDGMDISLCVIDKEAGKLDFAGANNPLYMIRDGSLIIVEADKMPIGIYYEPDRLFTNKTLEIKKGDYLYFFSDGYADQFGGRRRKKYMYVPFQQLLLHNHNKTMDLQKEILDNTFVKWKGANEQIDDVLVIGLHL